MASVSAEEVDAAAVVRRGCAALDSPLMKMKLRADALRTALSARVSLPVIVKVYGYVVDDGEPEAEERY